MMTDDSYETVAITYSQPETAVMLSMFSFYGIPAYARGHDHARTASTLMVALGGIHIRVRADALEEARTLLTEVAERPPAVRRPLIDNPALNAVIVILFCMIGAPVPPTRVGSSFFLGERIAS